MSSDYNDRLDRIEGKMDNLTSAVNDIRLTCASHSERERNCSSVVQDLKLSQRRMDKDIANILAKDKAKGPFWYAAAQLLIALTAIGAAVSMYMRG